MTPLIKSIIGGLCPSFAGRRRVIRALRRKAQAMLSGTGKSYSPALKGKEFWAYLVAVEMAIRPLFYVFGIPMAVLLYVWGIYGIFA
jgi:hypothetical protein